MRNKMKKEFRIKNLLDDFVKNFTEDFVMEEAEIWLDYELKIKEIMSKEKEQNLLEYALNNTLTPE